MKLLKRLQPPANRPKRRKPASAPRAPSSAPEQHINVPEPVPVYITYLTAMPGENGIAFHDDVYNRDASALVGIGADPLAPLAAR